MTNVTEFPDLALTREQAAQWIARISRGLSADEQAQLRAWCAQPANARTLRQMSALWNELDVMRVLADVFPEAPGNRAAPASPVTPATPRRWRSALAASVIIGLLLTTLAVVVHDRTGSPATPVLAGTAATYSTIVGEQRNVPLADGSSLAINTDSTVRVETLDNQQRTLRLLRGEAHFTVAHDPARPFRVTVGTHVVQAVGTAFSIRLHEDDQIDLLVTEGRVALLSEDGEVGQPFERGNLLHVAGDGGIETRHLDDDALAARMAWRGGMLLFDGQTLGDALAEFARYTATRFEVNDATLRQLRIGGYFPAGDTHVLLDTLKTNFGVIATRTGDGTIRLEPGQDNLPDS